MDVFDARGEGEEQRCGWFADVKQRPILVSESCFINCCWCIELGDLFSNDRSLKVMVVLSVIKDFCRCLYGGFGENMQ